MVSLLPGSISVVDGQYQTELNYYILEVAPFGTNDFVEIDGGNGNVDGNGILGNFDPSLLLNDAYTLRLSAVDNGGNISTIEETIFVEGDLKLGNFQLSFTDLTIPVAGIPISVTRTYDTLRANRYDDFGYGWRLEFRDTNLRTSLDNDAQLATFGLPSAGFTVGDKVYLTLPGGQRESFVFQPRPHRFGGFLTSPTGTGGLFYPAFISEQDSNNVLSVTDANTLLTRRADGQFVSVSGYLYNPSADVFNSDYVLTTGGGIEFVIDSRSGDLLTVTDTNDNVLRFSEAGITSDTGIQVRFGRDARGRITKVIDPSGNEIEYDYDRNGDLIAVTDREDNTTRFGYDDVRVHFLDEIIDPLGRTGVRTEYNEDGRLSKVIDVNGEEVELIYDTDNSTQTTLDVFGNPTTYVYDDRGNVLTEVDPVGKITERTYDDRDNVLIEKIIADGKEYLTTYTYDQRNNILTTTDSLGNTYTNTYDSQNNILTTTDPLGNTTTRTYDRNKNVTSVNYPDGSTATFDYDSTGRLTALSDGGITVFQNFYDNFGNVIRQLDAEGNETTFTYDANGNRLSESKFVNGRILTSTLTRNSEGNITSLTDFDGNTITYEYDANQNKIATVDQLGHRYEYRYNEQNLLVEVILPDETPNDLSDNPRTKTEYDALGQESATIDELGRRTEYVYDELGRIIETIFPDATPNDISDNPRTLIEYDMFGHMIAQIDEIGNRTEFEYDGGNRQTVMRNALGFETLFSYDVADRMIRQTDALGRATEMIYDPMGRLIGSEFADGTSTSTVYNENGWVVAQIDQAGNKTEFEYDNIGRLTAVVDALSQRTEYEYNSQSQLVTQRDANGNITEYEYDDRGYRDTTILDLGQQANMTYDLVGNINSATDFNGDTMTYEYDARNRMITKEYSDGTVFEYTYTLTGQRETVTDSRGTTTYSYDERDRLISRADPDGNTIEYTYDDVGNVLSMTTISGTTSYIYDRLNRLEMVIDPNGQITEYTYDQVNNLIQTEFANSNIEVREYDDLDRLLLIETSNSTGVIAGYRYTLDEVGNRVAVEEKTGRKVEYTYDDVYRIISEDIFAIDAIDPTRTIDYSYDNVGNRLQKNDSEDSLTIYDYDDNDRLISENQDGVITNYTYDDNGNLLSKTNNDEQILYSWNIENLLVGVDTDGDGSTDVEYQYDTDGTRVSENVAGTEKRFLVDTNRQYAQVIEEYDVNGIVEAKYVYGHDLISQERQGQYSFYHVDGLGSTTALSDETGAVTDQYIYDAFGEIIEQVGDTDNSYLFAGEWRDTETGLDYLRARYLDSQTGRFVSRDTFRGSINDPVTLHRYLYANANPIMFVDPSGFVSASVNDFVIANKINNILNTSIRLGNSFLTILDKVDVTFSVIDTFWMVFKLGSGELSLFPSSLTSLSPSSTLPDLNIAVTTLRANAKDIVTGVVTKKIPQELNNFQSFFNATDSSFAFFPPDIIATLLPASIPTGLKIYKKPLVISNNSAQFRLFGTGMVRPTRRGGEAKIQFFRMDYGPYNHARGPDRRNWDTWDDGIFHFHIPKN
ncbi:RHS repeat-associated core domain-containing protein [Cyanobacterium aponinum UTEX 3222]|uniref:RHS repeat-associated core domain-containing protein n=1 Tax=Cyanobacterium aponinum TaxID=379064 RepID=UPI00308BB228|nr:RHS repeat-associated core domain-containing protein [Cyanobacterium aponinum UTEX 3222]